MKCSLPTDQWKFFPTNFPLYGTHTYTFSDTHRERERIRCFRNRCVGLWNNHSKYTLFLPKSFWSAHPKQLTHPSPSTYCVKDAVLLCIHVRTHLYTSLNQPLSATATEVWPIGDRYRQLPQSLVFTADNPCLSHLYGQKEIFMAHAVLTSLHGKTQSFNHTMYS